MHVFMDWIFAADARGLAAEQPGFACSAAAAWPRKSSAPLAALSGNPLAGRFHNWRGASGRRYICTIFADRAQTGDFADALILNVRRDADGGRSLLGIAGSDATLAKGVCSQGPAACANEWHVHLMAATRAAREEAMADLQQAAERC